MKHRFLITGLATATILSAVALNQVSPSVYAAESTTQPAGKPATTTAEKTEVEKAKEAETAANAKVDEA